MPKRIVIIDDEDDSLAYLCALLTDNGFEPHAAKNGQDGLDLINAIHPDLVCLDILMPGQTGIGLFKEMKKDKELKSIPVMIVSGLNLGKEMAEGGKTVRGIVPDAYIEKPIQASEFVEMVRKLA